MNSGLLLVVLAGCGARQTDWVPTEDRTVPTAILGAELLGHGRTTIVHSAGTITQVGGAVPGGVALDDQSGQCLAPAFIDSHVHLAFRPEADEMRAGGVVGVVDLAAPVGWLATRPEGLHVKAAGPMITALQGYPTQSWGADGYGEPVSGAEQAAAATSALIASGADLIKVPLTDAPTLTDEELAAVVDTAHQAGKKVVAHALSEEAAARAAAAGVDALAHTPTEALSDATVQAWADKAVISTLRAFGGSATTIDNLRRLHEAGATVLYGTDFGNTLTAGIDEAELQLLREAGLGAREVRLSATEVPADFWGFDAIGRVAEGNQASFWIGSCDCLWCD